MTRLLVFSLCVAVAAAAPAYNNLVAGVAPIGYGVSVPQIHETVHVGPAVAKTHVQHGIIGSRTVQIGTEPVQVGHQFVKSGETVHQAAPYSYVAGKPVITQSTRQLPLAPLPPAAPAAVAIPPAPRNLGPAPADTVVQEEVLAPVRTHTKITPRVTRIEPELRVNKYEVDVPVPVPVPVEREVVVQKHVAKPFTVEVPQPVAVPKPYKVHPVQKVVETPVIHKQTYTVHQPLITRTGYAHFPLAPTAHVYSY